MLEKILVPLDGSEMFSETHCYIRAITEHSESECILVHILTDEENQDAYAAEEAACQHPLIKKLYEALAADNINVTAVVRAGDPVGEISKLSAQLPASLLLMSTHGRSGLDNIRVGSVTEQVVRQSPCPVFILHSTRPDAAEARCDNLFRRMLVPLDGSKVSAAILPCVEKFAALFHTEVILFHDGPQHNESQAVKERRETIESHGVQLANAGISVKLHYSTHQRPISEILERTQDLGIDIIAMATHGIGGKRRPLEESVTANVMRHADRPLLVWSSDPQCPPVP